MDDIPEEILNSFRGRNLNEITLRVMYKNWKGEIEERKIIPLSVYYGSNEYHKEEQWLMNVWDLDKRDFRDYALNGIEKWL